MWCEQQLEESGYSRQNVGISMRPRGRGCQLCEELKEKMCICISSSAGALVSLKKNSPTTDHLEILD